MAVGQEERRFEEIADCAATSLSELARKEKSVENPPQGNVLINGRRRGVLSLSPSTHYLCLSPPKFFPQSLLPLVFFNLRSPTVEPRHLSNTSLQFYHSSRQRGNTSITVLDRGNTSIIAVLDRGNTSITVFDRGATYLLRKTGNLILRF